MGVLAAMLGSFGRLARKRNGKQNTGDPGADLRNHVGFRSDHTQRRTVPQHTAAALCPAVKGHWCWRFHESGLRCGWGYQQSQQTHFVQEVMSRPSEAFGVPLASGSQAPACQKIIPSAGTVLLHTEGSGFQLHPSLPAAPAQP